MKNLFLLTCVGIIISCSSKNDDTVSQAEKSLTIADYLFEVPADFKLIEGKGIDSYVGSVKGNDYTITFDYGWYTSSFENLPADAFEVSVDTVDGYYKQTVKALNPIADFTALHLYKISDSIESPFGYNAMHMVVSGISSQQQDEVVQIFSSAIPLD